MMRTPSADVSYVGVLHPEVPSHTAVELGAKTPFPRIRHTWPLLLRSRTSRPKNAVCPPPTFLWYEYVVPGTAFGRCLITCGYVYVMSSYSTGIIMLPCSGHYTIQVVATTRILPPRRSRRRSILAPRSSPRVVCRQVVSTTTTIFRYEYSYLRTRYTIPHCASVTWFTIYL